MCVCVASASQRIHCGTEHTARICSVQERRRDGIALSLSAHHALNAMVDAAAPAAAAGDVVNSKTRIVETTSDMIGHGYSAIYYWSPSSSSYTLAASVLRHSDGTLQVDVELPSKDWLEELRLSSEWLSNDHATVSKQLAILGQQYIVSAVCKPKDTVIDSEGSLPSMAAAGTQCTGYLVQGMPLSVTDGITAAGIAWQVREAACACVRACVSDAARVRECVSVCECACVCVRALPV